MHDPALIPPPPAALTACRLLFKYTAHHATLATLSIDGGHRLLEVVGDPDNAAYEWVISRDGIVEQHSDLAYGGVDVAMRDGLIAAIGLGDHSTADLLRDAPQLLQQLSFLLRSLTVLPADSGVDQVKAADAAAMADELIARLQRRSAA